MPLMKWALAEDSLFHNWVQHLYVNSCSNGSDGEFPFIPFPDDGGSLHYSVAAFHCPPSLPPQFEVSHPDGLCPGWSVKVKGETGSSANMFQINFLCDTREQIAFHFNPRFADSVIICNSFLDNCWGQEVVTDTFPLEAKEPFQIEIYSDQDYFHVFVDERKVLQYEHRQKQLSTISKVQILDDIHISSVEVTRRGLF